MPRCRRVILYSLSPSQCAAIYVLWTVTPCVTEPKPVHSVSCVCVWAINFLSVKRNAFCAKPLLPGPIAYWCGAWYTKNLMIIIPLVFVFFVNRLQVCVWISAPPGTGVIYSWRLKTASARRHDTFCNKHVSHGCNMPLIAIIGYRGLAVTWPNSACCVYSAMMAVNMDNRDLSFLLSSYVNHLSGDEKENYKARSPCNRLRPRPISWLWPNRLGVSVTWCNDGAVSLRQYDPLLLFNSPETEVKSYGGKQYTILKWSTPIGIEVILRTRKCGVTWINSRRQAVSTQMK